MVERRALRIFGAFAYNVVGRKRPLRPEQGFTERTWARSNGVSEMWL
jgi:hypothetical protein